MSRYRKSLGKKGEQAVQKLLVQKGYKILESNFQTRYGEIDIIAEQDRVLVFVEVKTRANMNYGMPAEAVDFRKQSRIRRTASEFLMNCKKRRYNQLRFDVAAVYATNQGEIKDIQIYTNAF